MKIITVDETINHMTVARVAKKKNGGSLQKQFMLSALKVIAEK
jgi:hypothetical protein